MTLRENRLRSGEDRELRRDIQLVLKIAWDVYRSAYGSRSRCARVSENIFVVLGRLILVLWTQANCKDISMAKKFVTANEIEIPANIVGIKLLDPLPEIW